MEWRSPGRTGSILYLVLALVVTAAAAVVTRLTVARRRGHRRAVTRLPDGPIIVVSNHTSYADGVLLALACRRLGRSVRLLATSGVFRAPVLGPIVTRLGFIRVDRGSASAARSLDVAEAALRAGEAVALFPEGRTTRNPDHWPERAKTGAVRLALRTGAPVVPVAMVGSHRLMPRERPLRSLLTAILLRPRVLVEVGEEIDVRSMADREPVGVEDIRRLSDEVMAHLVTLVAEVRGQEPPDRIGAHPKGLSAPESC